MCEYFFNFFTTEVDAVTYFYYGQTVAMQKDGYESDGSLNHADEEWDNKPTMSVKAKQDTMKLSVINILRINQERQDQLGKLNNKGKTKAD